MCLWLGCRGKGQCCCLLLLIFVIKCMFSSTVYHRLLKSYIKHISNFIMGFPVLSLKENDSRNTTYVESGNNSLLLLGGK